MVLCDGFIAINGKLCIGDDDDDDDDDDNDEEDEVSSFLRMTMLEGFVRWQLQWQAPYWA